jgi:peptidoglycan/LPS O-acetylase OafA/YrhL
MNGTARGGRSLRAVLGACYCRYGALNRAPARLSSLAMNKSKPIEGSTTFAQRRHGLWASLSFEECKLSRFFPSPDGLRAIAALLMIFGHYRGAGEQWMGWLGIQAFFVLSGFLIATLLLRESEATGTVSLGRLYLRRAFRIMPAYGVVLAFVTWQLGRRFYSSYLLQIIASQAVTDLAPWRVHGYIYTVLTLAAGLFLADVMLRYIKRPMISFGHMLEMFLTARGSSPWLLQQAVGN